LSKYSERAIFNGNSRRKNSQSAIFTARRKYSLSLCNLGPPFPGLPFTVEKSGETQNLVCQKINITLLVALLVNRPLWHHSTQKSRLF